MPNLGENQANISPSKSLLTKIPTRDLIQPRIKQGKKKRMKKQVRIDENIEQLPKEKNIDDCAVNNYCRFFGIEKGCATIEQVKESSAGIL